MTTEIVLDMSDDGLFLQLSQSTGSGGGAEASRFQGHCQASIGGVQIAHIPNGSVEHTCFLCLLGETVGIAHLPCK